jgi:hypothetical protein
VKKLISLAAVFVVLCAAVVVCAVDFAPNNASVVSLGTKGNTTMLVDGLLQQYQFKFVNTSDYSTASVNKVKFLTSTGVSKGEAYSSGDTWAAPKGVKSVVFTAISTATPKSVILWKMKR